ncbi:histamine N-methyltransferase-like [Scyliorhinus canicula]|uniref:histamine N-methyltransferase-like n=1 Tax=Scyliorhinus canicula TaxID=7830 RepID=UPI0018F43FFB|nr:histamine N-methyltransferase-like [Scyliorhinus canicula]
MEAPVNLLFSDFGLYVKTFEVYIERSTQHQCTKKFIDENLSDLVTSIGKKGASCLNVLGLGSGSGEMDLAILSKIQSQHPGLPIHNEVVEPLPQQISKYKDLVKEKGQGLNISFIWNQLSSEEYVKQNKERKESKKFDFIHMIQMVYYVESIHDTIKYFHSLLETNGKLLIIYNPDYTRFRSLSFELAGDHFVPDVQKVLDELRMKYQICKLSFGMDVTECFIEGNENGEHLLDFITHIAHFKKSVSADQKDAVLQQIRQPQFIKEENGQIILNRIMCAIVVDP